jgi:hypothetical protein
MAVVKEEEAGDDESRSGTVSFYDEEATMNLGVLMTKKTAPNRGGGVMRGRRQQSPTICQSIKRKINREREKGLHVLCIDRTGVASTRPNPNFRPCY